MTGERDPAAPERYLPEEHGPLPAYEHIHRYVLASAALGAGRRALDLGSGSGHGSGILRETGAWVVALDLDPASLRRAPPGVRARAELLPFGDASFDAVVCFETLEHLADPAALLCEAGRVLRPDGAVLLSTPDRDLYTERAGNRNPHHVHELSRKEFAALLSDHFPHVRLYGQSVWAGSWIAPLEAAAVGTRRLRALVRAWDGGGQAQPAPWADPADAGLPVPLFLLAVCAKSRSGAERIARRLAAESVLHDPGQTLLGHYLGSLEGLRRRDREIEDFAAHARNLETLLDERRARVESLEVHCDNLERVAKRWEAQALSLGEHAGNLEALLRARDERVAGLEAHTANLEERCASLGAHVENLEALLRARDERVAGLEAHTANLEERCASLAAHVENLEALLRARDERVADLETHTGNLEERCAGLAAHVENLEALLRTRDERVAGLESHAANLEVHRDGLRTHADNLEKECLGLRAQAHGLEASVRELEAELARREARGAELEEGLAAQLERNAAVLGELHATRGLLDALRAQRSVRWLRWAGLLPERLVPRKP